ncbi:MAG: hypothetical protein QOG40_6 [Solirubrobacteraceae bacterium]|nr:hypothetical protein [Solirubrobacteraceae bacterium]
MRRMLILAGLGLAVGLLASCGKGSLTGTGGQAASSGATTSGSTSPHGQSPSARRAVAFAHAVNLTSDDVPGFTASQKHSASSDSEKQLERQMLHCAGLGGSAKAVAEESSQSFRLKHQIIDLSVSSEVAVEASAAQAQRSLSAIRSSHVRGCFTRYLQQILQRQQVNGATAGPVTIQSGTPPAPGMSGSFGWRVTATFLVRGIKVPIYLDYLGFVDGPSQVTLLSSGLLQPFPADAQQHLFSLLLSRARSHKL